jgi:hypothetical protein
MPKKYKVTTDKGTFIVTTDEGDNPEAPPVAPTQDAATRLAGLKATNATPISEPTSFLGGALKGAGEYARGVTAGALNGLVTRTPGAVVGGISSLLHPGQTAQDLMSQVDAVRDKGLGNTMRDGAEWAAQNPFEYGQNIGGTAGAAAVLAKAPEIVRGAPGAMRGAVSTTGKGLSGLGQLMQDDPTALRPRVVDGFVPSAISDKLTSMVGRPVQAVGDKLAGMGSAPAPTAPQFSPAQQAIMDKINAAVARAQEIRGTGGVELPAAQPPAGQPSAAPPSPSIAQQMGQSRYTPPDIGPAPESPSEPVRPWSGSPRQTSIANEEAAFKSGLAAKSGVWGRAGHTMEASAGTTLQPAQVEQLKTLGYPNDIIIKAGQPGGLNPAEVQGLIDRQIQFKPNPTVEPTGFKPVADTTGTFHGMDVSEEPSNFKDLPTAVQSRVTGGMDKNQRRSTYQILGGLDAEGMKAQTGQPSYLGLDSAHVQSPDLRPNVTPGQPINAAPQTKGSFSRALQMIQTVNESPIPDAMKKKWMASVGAGLLAAELTGKSK